MFNRILIIMLAMSLLLLPAGVAGAQEEQTVGLSLKEATKMALDRNRDILSKDLSVEKAEEQMEDMRSSLDHYLRRATFDPDIDSAFSGYLSGEAGERIAQKNYEYARQQLVVDVKDYYYTVLKNIDAVANAEKSVKLYEVLHTQAQVKKQLGMMAEVEVYGVETQLSNAKSQLVSAKNDLENSYLALNILIGRNDTKNPVLVDECQFEKADLQPMDGVIAQVLSQNHEIWAAEKSAEVAKRTAEFSSTYNVSLIDADIKAIDAGNVKEQIRQQVKTLYLSLGYMEEAHEALTSKLTSYEETYRVAKLKKELGLVNNSDLLEAENNFLFTAISSFFGYHYL